MEVGDIVRLSRGDSPLIIVEVSEDTITGIYISQLIREMLHFRNKYPLYITKPRSHFTNYKPLKYKGNTMDKYTLINDTKKQPTIYTHVGTSFDGHTYMLQSPDNAVVNFHTSMIKPYIAYVVKAVTMCREPMTHILDIPQGHVKVDDIISIPNVGGMLRVVDEGNLNCSAHFKPSKVTLMRTHTIQLYKE